MSRDFLAVLEPRTLRELAAVIETRRPQPRHDLTPEGVDKLADILLAGSSPTIGFWRRYGRVPA